MGTQAKEDTVEALLQELLGPVPTYARYLTLAEIRAHIDALREQPGFSVTTIGQSAEGLPIDMIQYDGGSDRTVLLWGFEDPTEPIGALTMFWLCDQLRERNPQLMRFRCNWAIIPTINPDGVWRNEEWFLVPGDLRAFAGGSWEPPYERILYWDAPTIYPEMAAWRAAVSSLTPDVLFDMHDDSHFPAPGYHVVPSSTIESRSTDAHLAFVRSTGMPLADPPVAPPSTIRDPRMSLAFAFEVNPDCMAFFDEVCGYAPSATAPDHERAAPQQATVIEAIDRYLEILDLVGDDDVVRIESARSQARHARHLIANGEDGAKALAVSCCALRVLRRQGYASEADAIDEVFWQYISSQAPPDAVRAIPIRDQVRVQLHLLFTILAERGYLRASA